ncbi:MAG: MASE3 domain-containing protein [Planctomycetota bacterium]
MGNRFAVLGKSKTILVGLLVFAGLHATALYNYLLFHTLGEMFSIAVACGIFMLAWNSRRFCDNNYLLFLGVAYLFVGAIDLIHTLAYEGMGVFEGYGTNLATQLWLVARYTESISLLLAPLFLGRKLRLNLILAAFALVTFLSLASIFYWDIFPVCFDRSIGLTGFKKASEYVISAILSVSVILLLRKHREFDRRVLEMLTGSILLTIASELSFTLYRDAYGLANEIGHFLKFVSFYLVYKAVIETGIREPYAVLLRNLKQSNDLLRQEKDIVRNYLDVAGVIIVIIDANEKVTLINNKGCRSLGYTENEILGKNWFDTFVPAGSREHVRSIFRKLIAGDIEAAGSFENPIVTKDGREQTVIWSNAVLTDETGRVVATLSSGTDITERKEIEKERENLVRMLESKNKELERFAGVIRHDLGNPLFSVEALSTSIAGYCNRLRPLAEGANLAKEPKGQLLSILKEHIPKAVNYIQVSITQMKRLLEGLRQLAAVGYLPLETEAVDVNGLLNEIIGTIRYKFEGCGASITVGSLPRCLGDATQLHQVFDNLIDNAIKYRSADRKGSIHIHGWVEDGMSGRAGRSRYRRRPWPFNRPQDSGAPQRQNLARVNTRARKHVLRVLAECVKVSCGGPGPRSRPGPSQKVKRRLCSPHNTILGCLNPTDFLPSLRLRRLLHRAVSATLQVGR